MTPGAFTGLSAFPLTPVDESGGGIDEVAYRGLVERLAAAGVDSIAALGSTGSYAYLDRDARRRTVGMSVAEAGGTPVIAGVGATSTRDVLRHAEDAQAAGASALLLAPVSYQPLTSEEVLGLFEDLDAAASVPIVVYDNPGTTRFTFTDELHGRIAALPRVASIKIPPVEGGAAAVTRRLTALRSHLPSDVTVGISGDPVAAEALVGGCDGWYSVLAGVLPTTCLAIVAAARSDRPDRALELSRRHQPLWALFERYGSYRVVSALAEQLGLVRHPNLPRPVLGLDDAARRELAEAVTRLREDDLLGDDLIR